MAVPAGAGAGASQAPATSAATAAAGVTITTRRISGFETVLVDGRGLPLYIFTRDGRRRSRCFGECERAWPVTYTSAKPRARGSAKRSLVGRIRRGKGRYQATYRGRPLCYYIHDRPGVALCHNVREFGGRWLLVRPSGKRV